MYFYSNIVKQLSHVRSQKRSKYGHLTCYVFSLLFFFGHPLI